MLEFLRGNALISAYRKGENASLDTKMRAGRKEYARTNTEMRVKQRRNARKTQTCTFDICAPPTLKRAIKQEIAHLKRAFIMNARKAQTCKY